MLRRIRHRVKQFIGALRPRINSTDRATAAAYLSDGERQLFESMMLRDQQHGIAVLERVRRTGAADEALCTAALLHDCGKGLVALWQRVAYVVLAAAAPALLRKLAAERGTPWRMAFWRLLHHPQIGARLVADAGSDPEVVRLIREQEAPQPDARLALLQAADEA